MDICIIHLDLNKKGGAELVCIEIIEELQADHNVVLITNSEPNFEELNDFYKTDVKSSIDTCVLPKSNWMIQSLTDIMKEAGLINLRRAVFNRLVNFCDREFDVVISTDNEYYTGDDSIQFIHFPNFNREKIQNYIEQGGVIHFFYHKLVKTIAGVDPYCFSSDRLVANSNWTAGIVESVYNTEPEVIYPPIDTRPFYSVPWKDKENGFVAVGRITPDKRWKLLIDVITRLRADGVETHLHIVGHYNDKKYAREVRELISNRDGVVLEGELSRSKLVSLICRHKYGIHGKKYEHFGLAVAEFVAGGAIPFVPDAGGQIEIVGEIDVLKYSSKEDAVSKATRVLSSPARQKKIIDSLPDVDTEFGRARFKSDVRELVESEK